MLKTTLRTMLAASMIAAGTLASVAADYTLRATANSNENDEDYDGLVVFKNYVEAASNGAIEVELFIGTQLCSKGAECLQGVADGSIDIYISTSGAHRVFSPMSRFSICPICCAMTASPKMSCRATSSAQCGRWRWTIPTARSA